jgi:membrane-bound lytic murein transglycosylase D
MKRPGLLSMLRNPALSCAVLLSVALLSVSTPAFAAGDLIPRPAELDPDVQFWIKVYTRITTNEGYLHDQHKLSVIYETIHFDADTPVHERKARVEAQRTRIEDALRHLASGAPPADADEQKVRDLWGGDTVPARFAEAVDDVRFQLGQSDRFRAGIVRAGAWDAHIAEVLANLGLPAQIAALPHVESSFDPAAYSKVGAAGLWQFMRSTGRRFMRIDNAVDERLDPFRETEAAAQLLNYNYRLLGSWPLAITAYNHGAEGMLRARDQLGTDDIVRIVREYHSPTFGFASRNFYVSFLAALTIAEDPEKYFGSLHRGSEAQFVEVKLSSSASSAALVKTLGVERDTLRTLNPALRPAVWNGQRAVPAGYVVRLPGSSSKWTSDLLTQRLGAAKPVVVAAVTPPASVPTPATVASNAATSPATAAPAPASVVSPAGEVANVAAPATVAAAAAAATASAPGTAPGPGQTISMATEAAASQYYLVQNDDTVQTIAARTGVTVTKLMELNSIPDPDYIYGGQRLRLVAAAPEPETVTTAATLDSAKAAVRESEEEDQAMSAADKVAANTEPVSAAQEQDQGPQLAPGMTGQDTADPVNYSVNADGSITVVAAETLGHYADWLGTSANKLRLLNKLRGRKPVVMGHRLKLEFDRVSPAQFEQKRRDYHERLQAAYFASHRIAGAEVYVARRGDSLWNITQRNVKVPIWLLQQYNPDLDFSDLRPGTQISLPKVEDVSGL